MTSYSYNQKMEEAASSNRRGSIKDVQKQENKFEKLMGQCDLFSQRVQGFNIRGEQYFTTRLGSLMTLISAAIILIYAVTKAQHVHSISG